MPEFAREDNDEKWFDGVPWIAISVESSLNLVFNCMMKNKHCSKGSCRTGWPVLTCILNFPVGKWTTNQSSLCP